MKTSLLVVASAVVSCGLLAAAQEEKPVPKDSERIAIPGCARGTSFIVSEPSEHEPIRSDVRPGQRFRIAGPKRVLDAVRAREAMELELTGLVRKGQMDGPGGVSIAGGRIRIGGALPRAPIYGDPRREPIYNEVVMDVESWRVLPQSCPSR